MMEFIKTWQARARANRVVAAENKKKRAISKLDTMIGPDPNVKKLNQLLFEVYQTADNSDRWRLEKAAHLLRRGASPDAAKETYIRDGKYGLAPLLYIALNMNDYKFAELLIDHGADLKYSVREDKEFKPVLHEFAQHGDKALLRKVLERGADPTAKDYLNKTALEQSRIQGLYDIVEIIEDFQAGKLTPQSGALKTVLVSSIFNNSAAENVNVALEKDAYVTRIKFKQTNTKAGANTQPQAGNK